MSESIVEIEGHLYRYEYDPASQKTLYRGPVGDAPPLTEEMFRDLLLQPEQLPTNHDEFKEDFPNLLEVTREWVESKPGAANWIIGPEYMIDSEELYVWKNGQPVTRDQLMRAERALNMVLNNKPINYDGAYINENRRAFNSYSLYYRKEADEHPSLVFEDNPMMVVQNHELRKKLEKVHPDFKLMSDLMKHLQMRYDNLFDEQPR
jgi:hypothetical protein